MSVSVTVVDYGLGNLFSVSRALEIIGASTDVTDSPHAVLAASHLILPGVGAFRDGMHGLHERGLVQAVKEYAGSGRPFLGICLGMQLLFEWSEEFGHCEGLGLLPGGVVPIPAARADGQQHRIPHMGWAELVLPKGRTNWDGTILREVQPGAAVYFVHSFAAEPRDPAQRLADCEYDGCRISAAVSKGSIYGCQFHPEKSAKVGLSILQTFISLGAD